MFSFSVCVTLCISIYCIVSVGVSWSTNLTIFDGKEDKEKKKVGINESETENQIVSFSIRSIQQREASYEYIFIGFFRGIQGKCESFAHLLLNSLDSTKTLHQFGTVEISIKFPVAQFFRTLFTRINSNNQN